jgi:hypothetical protein
MIVFAIDIKNTDVLYGARVVAPNDLTACCAGSAIE